jgi:hypothetical protein
MANRSGVGVDEGIIVLVGAGVFVGLGMMVFVGMVVLEGWRVAVLAVGLVFEVGLPGLETRQPARMIDATIRNATFFIFPLFWIVKLITRIYPQ